MIMLLLYNMYLLHLNISTVVEASLASFCEAVLSLCLGFIAICPPPPPLTRYQEEYIAVCLGVDGSNKCRVSSLSHTSWHAARASQHE